MRSNLCAADGSVGHGGLYHSQSPEAYFTQVGARQLYLSPSSDRGGDDRTGLALPAADDTLLRVQTPGLKVVVPRDPFTAKVRVHRHPTHFLPPTNAVLRANRRRFGRHSTAVFPPTHAVLPPIHRRFPTNQRQLTTNRLRFYRAAELIAAQADASRGSQVWHDRPL